MRKNQIPKIKKWRRINLYRCQGCGNKRKSFVYTRAQGGFCMKCRALKIAENQPTLFGLKIVKDNTMPVGEFKLKEVDK